MVTLSNTSLFSDNNIVHGSLLRNSQVEVIWICGVSFVVQFYPWFKFYFLLFLGMLMFDNEFKTKENKI